MYEKMLSAKPALERWIPLIALTAATAPLLGLLGTVTGMINTFNMITVFGTGDPRMLSGGISEALITTKFGLVVAVPALICHAFVTPKGQGVSWEAWSRFLLVLSMVCRTRRVERMLVAFNYI